MFIRFRWRFIKLVKNKKFVIIVILIWKGVLLFLKKKIFIFEFDMFEREDGVFECEEFDSFLFGGWYNVFFDDRVDLNGGLIW